jgi:DNA-binding SARP family transcriptional activator/tetratricopeptide (TPR) repeat protein
MEFRILGPFEVAAGGEPLQLRGARQRELLAVLLLHANEVVSSDRLLDDLWQGEPPPTAAKVIQNSVSQLRKLLGSDRLVTRSPGYLLRVEPGELDADRFEELVGAGARDEALALWRGPVLADFTDTWFARAEVARLTELRTAAIEDGIEAGLAEGRHAELVPELEALTATYPLRERFRAQLMVALYRSGRQAEALQVYQATRETLVEELGLEPSPELQRLERAVLTQDASLELVPAPAEEPPAEEAEPAARETRKTVSVVAADVLPLGGPRDPEALRRPMEQAVETVTGVLERHGASTEASTSGGVIGIFGVPTVHEDDALRAVRAATEVRQELDRLTWEHERDWDIAFAVRSGVNTGEVVAHAATALVAGDAVMVASRLQDAAAPGEILLDEHTERLVRDAVNAERVDPADLTAVGREQAWRLLDLTAAEGYRRKLETPMVGRVAELAQLRQAYDRARAGGGVQLFTIVGAAGIGKTRLAAEFLRSLGDETTVLRGHSLSYGEAITFWPLREMVLQIPDLEGALAGEAEAATIRDRVVGAVGLEGKASSNEETFWATRRLFEALAREGPLVVVLEDVHWAEPALLDLIEHVSEWSVDSPILLLCLSRPELVDDRPRWAGGRANVASVVLEPLTADESDELITLILDGAELAPELRDKINEAAEGNPLFIEQMLAMVADQGADGGLSIPPTIHALLEARLEHLGELERGALQRASIMGRDFRRAALVDLSPRSETGAIGGALETLVRRELLRPVRDEGFRFRHLLLLEVAYDSVPKAERAELHERFAEWLEGEGEEQEEVAGHHLERAYAYRAELGPVGAAEQALARRAATRLGDAGRRAYERGDLQAAVELLSRAVELLEPGSAGRVELLADLGEALRETGDFDRAAAVLGEVVETARADGDRVLEARAEVSRLRLRLLTDPQVTEQVVRDAEPLVQVFEEAGDDRLLAKAWELLAWAPWFKCRAAATEGALGKAIDHARRAGDARTEAQSLNLYVGTAFFGPTPVPEAIRICEEILAQPGQQRRIVASALRALAGLKAMAGEFDEARKLVADHKAIAEELGLRVTAASAAETYGIVEMLAGDPAAAERELAAGYGALEEIGETQNFPDLAAKLADALYEQGEDERALELSEVSERATAPDDLSAGVQWRGVRAKLLARRGDAQAAEALAREAVALAEETDFPVLRGDALIVLDEVAGEGRAEAIRLYEEKGNVAAAERARSEP